MSSNEPAPPRTASIPPALAPPKPDFERLDENGLHPLVNEQTRKDTLSGLLFLRFINFLCVATFFQPDEYFQSLEPAWQLAFGKDAGAWITWEWRHQLRSSLHPAFFAGIYYVAQKIMTAIETYPQFHAMIHASLPNVAQALISGYGDWCTWQLAEKLYGPKDGIARAALLMTIFSPWQWFCSTRTFSNTLETTLTIAALNYWPWEITIARSSVGDEKNPTYFKTKSCLKNFRYSLLLAGLACILRPTNLLIWFSILAQTLPRLASSPSTMLILVREILLCGGLILAVSFASDYWYFGEATFPPYQWLNFNISQDLAVFYGRNDWHYYLSQGIPLLMTAYLPFTLVGLVESILLVEVSDTRGAKEARALLNKTVFSTIGALSVISHKEVRFIYPLLPLLHIITAPTINNFFRLPLKPAAPPASTTDKPTPKEKKAVPEERQIRRHGLLWALGLTNLFIAGYTSQIHQRGVIQVTKFLRTTYEQSELSPNGQYIYDAPDTNMTLLEPPASPLTRPPFVAFLMPCHSTPWRSALSYARLDAWALSCDPPIHLDPRSPARAAYRDQADRFYDDPVAFITALAAATTTHNPAFPPSALRWPPRFVAGFQGIEPFLREAVEKISADKTGHSPPTVSTVTEVWRAFNSHWIDDDRRKGDVVVWELT